MFCPYCGRQIDDNAAICLGCGRSTKEIKGASEDSSSVGWWWLGFFFPMIGFILWCIWTGDTPIRAKRAGWGALVGTITTVALVILTYVAIFAFAFWGALYL